VRHTSSRHGWQEQRPGPPLSRIVGLHTGSVSYDCKTTECVLYVADKTHTISCLTPHRLLDLQVCICELVTYIYSNNDIDAAAYIYSNNDIYAAADTYIYSNNDIDAAADDERNTIQSIYRNQILFNFIFD